ncbi:GPNloop GTPase putative [Caulochytrium protostelioides]|uniref:GPN-loop GTPase 3 n=1 Tax=Caulochytrium protostelioides TaxID=1555241 RepID=A0A4P9WXL3_9FUNG|nr:GPNloop GTPase putative [Caulochytrium protostelioides]
MGKLCQLVMGPAGSGKSTFCSTIISHAQATKRSMHLVNLDPAAEHFEYKPAIDIRDLISLDDVVEELHYGPNGGLIYCLEFLIDNIDWLEDELDNYAEDYLIIDCPGQIELYTHIPVMRTVVEVLQRLGYRVGGIYCLDSQFIDDPSKFFAGAMVQLEIAHINVMTKMDLLGEKGKTLETERFLDVDTDMMLERAAQDTSMTRFQDLNIAMTRLISEFNLVSFVPLDITDEDSIELVLSHIDHALQYGEDVEPKELPDHDGDDDDDDASM